jgi:hypothetical protein
MRHANRNNGEYSPERTPRPSANDLFSRDFDLTDLLSIAPAPTTTASAAIFVSAADPEVVPEPEFEAQPKSCNHIFTAYLQFERDQQAVSGAGPTSKVTFWGRLVDHR